MFLNYFSKSYYLTVTYGACSVLVRCFFGVSYGANCLLCSNDLHHTIIFFPAYKEAILRSLWACERFYIYPTQTKPDPYFCLIIKYMMLNKKTQALSYLRNIVANDNSQHYHPDQCVWLLNREQILLKIGLLLYGPFICFISQTNWLCIMGQWMANFILRKGFGCRF